MSETKRFTADKSGSMLVKVVWDMDGGWLRYIDHKAEVERLRGELDAERDAAQAEIERLTAERHQLRGDVEALTAERDKAQREVRVLQLHLEWDRKEIAMLRASGQEMRDTSRPSDEDIWREAFMRQLHDIHRDWTYAADMALRQYRERWPR